jgi:hypothetical protein
MTLERTHKALLLGSVLGILLVLVVVLVFQTALFHISPIKVGYSRFDFGKYVVFSKVRTADAEYASISDLLSQDESLHGLRYTSKVQIIFVEKQSDMNRYQPFASAADRRNAVSFAPWPNTIYVTPKVMEKYGSFQGALAHELSHVLVIQNYGIINAYLLWKLAEWIPEGYATYLSKWPSYFSKDHVAENLSQAGIDISNGQLLGSRKASSVPLPLRYMIYRYFVEYLFEKNSAATAIRFLKESCDNPREVESTFQKVFGVSFAEDVQTFSMELDRKGKTHNKSLQ